MAWQLPQLNFGAEEEEKPSKEWSCTELVLFCGGGWETRVYFSLGRHSMACATCYLRRGTGGKPLGSKRGWRSNR